MSFDLPARVERDLERYALGEQISTAEAAAKIIEDALKTKRNRGAKRRSEAVDWDKFGQLVPGLDLFRQLPDGTVESVSKSSRLIRMEKLKPRA